MSLKLTDAVTGWGMTMVVIKFLVQAYDNVFEEDGETSLLLLLSMMNNINTEVY
jgi:hypothetical protein